MKEKIAIISIFVNVMLALGKIFIWLISNLTSILAEWLHSFMDIFSSIVGYIGIKMSKKPADQKHPYGHYKFEVLAWIIITLILFITGIWIIYEAYKKFLHPSWMQISILAFWVMFFSVLINEIMARLKIYYGKKENSIALLSDWFHSRIDVYSSIVVLVGLFLIEYWVYVDSLLAFLVGIYIIKESFSLGKEAIDSLVDVSADPEIEEKIKEIAKSQNIEIDFLKTQKKGSTITTNFEIKLPNKLTVDEATKISQHLKEKLMKEITNLSYVAIQIKSHDVETGFYKTSVGRVFGSKGVAWQRWKRFIWQIENAQGKWPSGYCVCSKCGYKVAHQHGVPCSQISCPNCNINLIRE